MKKLMLDTWFVTNHCVNFVNLGRKRTQTDFLGIRYKMRARFTPRLRNLQILIRVNQYVKDTYINKMSVLVFNLYLKHLKESKAELKNKTKQSKAKQTKQSSQIKQNKLSEQAKQASK